MRVVSTFRRNARRGLLLATLTVAIIGSGVFIGSLLQGNAVSAATTSANTFDCDANSVIWCGADDNGAAKGSEITARYNNGDGHNSVAAIRGIYGSKWFNITSSDIQNLSKNAQLGTVTASGDVSLNGKVVATNALTAGRTNIAGPGGACGTSTPETIPGTKQTFYIRKPCVSFHDGNTLYAYVVMGDGQFKYAILLSCGNPVSATPKAAPKPPTPKTPSYTINKEVAVKGRNDYQKSVTVQSGTHVTYRIEVDSTGTAPVTDLGVGDKLPQNIQYVAGSLQEDGVAISASDFFGGDSGVGTLNPGERTFFTFEAVIGSQDTVNTCQAETLNNEAGMWATGLATKTSTAAVNKTCAPKPVYACTSLTPFQASDDTFKFTAQAMAKNGATVTGYSFDFGDNSQQPVTTAAETAVAKHTYATPGTYNVTVSVDVAVNGTTKTVTAPACATTVNVVAQPMAECTDLVLSQDATNPRQVSAAAKYTAQNGATLSSTSFDWGDGSTTPSTSQTASHTYQKDGDYTVKATLTFTAPAGNVPPSNCQAAITITTVPPICGNLTIDVNNDTRQVTVTGLSFTPNNGTYQFTDLSWGDNSAPVSASDITGQQHTYAADGPFTVVATPHFLVNGVDTPATAGSCQQTVKFTGTPPVTLPQMPPTQLVNTGASSTLGWFGLAVIAGVFGYRCLLSRRLNRPQA